MDVLPFPLETPLEQRIAADPRWQAGIDFGQPRPGHPEGAVKYHIAAVLENVDRFFAGSPERPKLRLIALIHDTFKHMVDPAKPRTGGNHHAMIARSFAESFIDDTALLDVIELHDEAYNAWRSGASDGRWAAAKRRAGRLVTRLGDTLDLYMAFYRCDNTTEGKRPDCYDWFVEWISDSE